MDNYMYYMAASALKQNLFVLPKSLHRENLNSTHASAATLLFLAFSRIIYIPVNFEKVETDFLMIDKNQDVV